jgi:hypothetical protein
VIVDQGAQFPEELLVFQLRKLSPPPLILVPVSRQGVVGPPRDGAFPKGIPHHITSLRWSWQGSRSAGVGRFLSILVITLALGGCDHKPATYTLYRNSPLDAAMRVHWATFDAADKGSGYEPQPYNQGNCEFDAKVLNDNAKRLNNGKALFQFWCEPGRYRANK